MTQIIWDAPGQKRYESGIDRGVLYTLREGEYRGVPWNGITSVELESTVDEPDLVYQDGVPFAFIPNVKPIEGTITAYTYPDQFEVCIGKHFDIMSGLDFTGQTQETFRLSFRSNVGDDIYGSESQHKIHLLYNLFATPESSSYSTIGTDVEAMEMSWGVRGLPEISSRFLPTVYVTIDTRRSPKIFVDLLQEILYGTPTSHPKMPDLQELITMLYQFELLTITDNGDGTFTAESFADGIIDIHGDNTFTLDWFTVDNLTAEGFSVESG